jgi:hypothetical protein
MFFFGIQFFKYFFRVLHEASSSWIKIYPTFLTHQIYRPGNCKLELVPTLMIDDAETKMRTEASVLFELKTSVPFCHALQICELIYVDIYLARSRQVLR